MLKIQYGISKNSASFGNNQQEVHVLGSEYYDNNTAKRLSRPVDEDRVVINIDDDAYTQQDYDSDKSFLEKQKESVENLVNNVDTPKPVKTFGKIILGAITVAMGFVSMKWATLGSWKVAEDIIKNPKTHKFVNKITTPFKNGVNSAVKEVKNSGIGDRISNAVLKGIDTAKEKFSASEIGKAVNNFAQSIKNNNIFKQGIEFSHKQYEKVTKFAGEKFKQITGVSKEKVKSYVSNFFGVSGAVTAGVDVIQSDGRQTENI